MADLKELKWTEDLVSSFSSLERSVNSQPLLVVAYLVLFMFGSVVHGAAPWVNFLVIPVIVQAITCEAVRRTWSDVADEETRQWLGARHGGPPLLSLMFLHIIYWCSCSLLILFLVVPCLWFAVKSCLAQAVVCVEDLGAVEALKVSHQITRGQYFTVVGYGLPVLLLAGLPVVGLVAGLDYGLNLLAELFDNQIVALAGVAITALLKAAFSLMAQVLVMCCLARLYVRLRGPVVPPAETQAD